MVSNISSIREAELSAALHSAFVASPQFLTAFLALAEAQYPELTDRVRSRAEYAPDNCSSRMDIYLWREEPALKIALEVKRAEHGVREDQIRDYLSLLRIIQPDGRLQKRRDAPHNAKLIVITGATETPELIERMRTASGGTLEPHLQWVSWYRLVDILDRVRVLCDQPNLRHLSELLAQLGYVSAKDSLPTLKTYQKILTNFTDILNDDSNTSEMEVLETTLSRVEYVYS